MQTNYQWAKKRNRNMETGCPKEYGTIYEERPALKIK
jgi:hypothetical protein